MKHIIATVIFCALTANAMSLEELTSIKAKVCVITNSLWIASETAGNAAGAVHGGDARKKAGYAASWAVARWAAKMDSSGTTGSFWGYVLGRGLSPRIL